MLKTTIFPGRYVQGPNSLNHLGKEIARLGDQALIVLDAFVMENLLERFKNSVEEAVTANFQKFNGECSEEEIQRLVQIGQESNCNIVVGIGGGKTHDTAKAVAHYLKVPTAIVPTIASTDAPCSALSVIYTPDGQFDKYLFLTKNPDLVLVDTQVIAEAPARFLVSGIGDALATYFEAESCRVNHIGNMTGNLGSLTAYALARLCLDTLLEYGLAARVACQAKVVTPALEKVVEANTLLSGIGFESGGLASAHAIHNGLTALEATHQYQHGEKVAIGVLAGMILTDRPPEEIDEIFDFCEAIGLPTTLADIGLENVSDTDLMKVAELTCADGETIHNEPMKVTPELVFNALRTVDAWGKARKNGLA